MPTVKLRVTSDYRSLGHDYKAGDEIDTSASLAEFFQRDAPGVFELVEPAVKALDEPPADKMVKKPARKK